jgi:hypothetical protein
MSRLGMPELLLVFAAALAMFGVRRLLSSETDSRPGTGQALAVSLALLAVGICLWLLTAFHRS